MKHKAIFYFSIAASIFLFFHAFKNDKPTTYSWVTVEHIEAAASALEPVFPKLENYFFDNNERYPSSMDAAGLKGYEELQGNRYIAGITIKHRMLVVRLKDPDSDKQSYFTLVPHFTIQPLALKWQCQIGNISRQLFETAYPECLGEESTPYTRLLEMIEFGVISEVEKAIKQGADVNRVSGKHIPLIMAVKNKNRRIVKLLLDSGANIEIKAEYDNDKTPLMFAVASGKMKVIKFLVERGANINARDTEGNSVLDYVPDGDEVLEDYLVEQGAEVRF